MSSQRGNVKKKAPKHQNTFAFKHNPKSKKTQHILALPIHGLCQRCHEQIEWRKKYRKYKPLTQPATCIYCHQKCVTAAYHAACTPCSKEKGVCAKCLHKKEIVPSAKELAANKEEKQKELEEELEGLRERERRTFLRKIEKEKLEAKLQARGEDVGTESYDEEEDLSMEDDTDEDM